MHVLLGLVVVLLATIPVLIPLLVTKAGGAERPDALRLAASPGVPALPDAAGGASATRTVAPPAGAGPLAATSPAATPDPTTSAPSTPPPAAPGSSAASTTPAPPTADPTTPVPTTADPTAGANVFAAGANLVVEGLSWSPQPPAAGQPVLFSAVVRNTGSDRTPAQQVSVTFSVDGTEVTWSANDRPPLAPGEERTYTADSGVTGAAWTATTGTHTVQAWVDEANQIPELNEDDNTATAPLVVP
jgi:hypothetical protein